MNFGKNITDVFIHSFILQHILNVYYRPDIVEKNGREKNTEIVQLLSRSSGGVIHRKTKTANKHGDMYFEDIQEVGRREFFICLGQSGKVSQRRNNKTVWNWDVHDEQKLAMRKKWELIFKAEGKKNKKEIKHQ